ncbi:efflux RND transporter periplasmic adaptor subunit [Deinococcus maricopensis]|uniref:Efflux transporter, RND family, MFP subunit n=1 Tax=Deinococcus maricopensis (strain DSM 21211 / LMG 22137 / NRRL B-23946 / LB-34) TaxID=709986 RepID=E8U665_DEIML|nr:efflux RND transporter periplasmic adaptor subunit [Deinococcus maricopensis]ADV66554.1 efflux transporter, RND family, MFP subunit [Deinococcus maricopensis DSM 21211]
MTTDAPPAPARTRKPRRRVWPAVLTVVLLGGAVTGGVLYRRAQTTTAEQTTTVQTATAQPGQVRVSVSGPATVQAARTGDLSVTVAGTITRVPSVGEHVRRGQLIAQVQADAAATAVTNARLALQKAQAQLASVRAAQASTRAQNASSTVQASVSVQNAERDVQTARTALDAQTRLYSVGGVSRVSVDDARAALAKAQATLATARAAQAATLQGLDAQTASNSTDLQNAQIAVDQARADLQDAETTVAGTKLYAPFDGTVSVVNGSVGGAVNANTALVTIIDDQTVDLPVQIDETQIGSVQVGQRADITLDALEDQSFTGTVTRLSPAATQDSGISYFTATVQVRNPDGLLRPGMTAEADIVQQEASGLIIPKRAVQTVRNRSYVQLAARTSGDDAERTRVHLGVDDGTNVIVESGLQPGDQVVLPSTTPRSSGGSGTRSGTRNATGLPGVGGLGTPGGFGGGR